MTRQKAISADLVFVLDATKSTQPVFNSMIDQVNNIAIDLQIDYRKADFKYGAVIYRDPVDYREEKGLPIDPQYKEVLDQIKAQEKKDRDERIRKAGLDPAEVDEQIAERKSHYDLEKYPFDKNVVIDLNRDIESLIVELMKVQCGSGNDDPEDWVGALTLALHSIHWRENSKRAIVWISDANAHGKMFCGFDNHNEEADKMEPLIQEMANMRIHFVGLNIVRKGDRGCERTLRKMKELSEKYESRTFRIEEYATPDDALIDDDFWPENVMTGLMDTLNKSLKSLGNLFDDSVV